MTMERTVSRMIMTTVIQMVIPMERIPYGILPQRVLLPVSMAKSGAGSQKGTSASGSVPIRHLQNRGSASGTSVSLQYFAAQVLLYAEEKHVRINLTGYNFI